MHGMFSITPDRASIHRGVDRALSARSEANMGAKWNKWLLDHCFVTAWIGALQMLKSLHDLDKYASYDWNRWPTAIDVSESSTCCDTDLLQRVFATVVKDDLPLIPTVGSKFERHSQVLYAETNLDRLLLSTLSDLGIPISLPRYHKALSSVKALSMLTPKAARYKLSTIEEKLYHTMKPKRRSALLAFIIADNDYADLKTCHAPVLPDLSGSYQPFSKTGLKLGLTELERAVFERPINYGIDVQKVDPTTLQQLRGDINTLQLYTGISRWDLSSASVYIRKELLLVDADGDNMIKFSIEKPRTWVELLWKWVTESGATSSQVVAAFEGIPLIPVHGSRLAKVTSNRNNLPLNISGHDTIGSLFSKKIQKTPDLVNKGNFSFYTVADILTTATANALRNCGVLLSSSTISDLAIWMSSPDNRSFVDLLDDDERTSLMGAINYLLRQSSPIEVTSVLRMLPIYKAAFNPQEWYGLPIFTPATRLLEH